jgi:trk system potassium uptake protein TrkA
MTTPRTSLHSVLVVGLGRFGKAAATSLAELGHEVMAIDVSGELVSQAAPFVAVALQADSTDDEALRQIGADEMDLAVVGIGAVEESVLTVAALSDLGMREIWAKAIDNRHGQILERIGATHVVYPEQQMGQRIAKTVSVTVEDYIELEGAFAVAKVHPPHEIRDKTLAECQLRTRHGVVAVGVARGSEGFIFATPDLQVLTNDKLMVGGRIEDVKEFAQLAHRDEVADTQGLPRIRG